MRLQLNDSKIAAIKDAARELGIKASDLATAIGYETIGRFSGNIRGGKNNKYIGAIQFGPWEQKHYGVTPEMSFEEQVRGPVVNYFRDRGLKPGMGLDDIYSTINAGSPGLYHRSDRPGYTVSRHVSEMQKSWLPQVEQALNEYDARNGVLPEFVKRTEAAADLGNIMAGQSGMPTGPLPMEMFQALDNMNVTAAPTPVAKRENPANPTFADNAVGPLRQKDYGYQTPRTINDLMAALGGPPQAPQQPISVAGMGFGPQGRVPSAMASVDLAGNMPTAHRQIAASFQAFPKEYDPGPIANPAEVLEETASRRAGFSPFDVAFGAPRTTPRDGLGLFDPIGPEVAPQMAPGPAQRLGPRGSRTEAMPEMAYGPSQRLGPRGPLAAPNVAGVPATRFETAFAPFDVPSFDTATTTALPETPGVQFMQPQDMVPKSKPVTPIAPASPPPAPTRALPAIDAPIIDDVGIPRNKPEAPAPNSPAGKLLGRLAGAALGGFLAGPLGAVGGGLLGGQIGKRGMPSMGPFSLGPIVSREGYGRTPVGGAVNVATRGGGFDNRAFTKAYADLGGSSDPHSYSRALAEEQRQRAATGQKTIADAFGGLFR